MRYSQHCCAACDTSHTQHHLHADVREVTHVLHVCSLLDATGNLQSYREDVCGGDSVVRNIGLQIFDLLCKLQVKGLASTGSLCLSRSLKLGT